MLTPTVAHPPAPAAPPEGDELLGGVYALGPLLGHGGMGLVREGEHVGRGERVAVKLLRADLAHVLEARQRFLREAASLRRLDDPHVVRVLEQGETRDGRPFFVMELLEGVCLGALAKRRVLQDVTTIAELVRQGALGLAAAHRAGIVHRDVKPQNLMVTADARGAARVTLLDFGIATEANAVTDDLRLTQAEVIIGTPVYMSPEQVRAPREADARSDVFSMGVVLYELLTERLPWHATSAVDLVVRQCTETPPKIDTLRSDVPPELAAVVARCLDLDPAARFADGAALAAALAPFARPIDARPFVVDDDLVHTVVRESHRAPANDAAAARALPSLFSEATFLPPPDVPDVRPSPEQHRGGPWMASRRTVVTFVLAAVLLPPTVVGTVRVVAPAFAARLPTLAR